MTGGELAALRLEHERVAAWLEARGDRVPVAVDELIEAHDDAEAAMVRKP